MKAKMTSIDQFVVSRKYNGQAVVIEIDGDGLLGVSPRRAAVLASALLAAAVQAQKEQQ